MKDASEKGKSNLSKELKRIGLMMRMSKFRQRLEYKCLINGIKISVVNEAYTSKVCSKCGNYKKELKGEKVYECLNCNVKRDRDLNSATNIILLTL
jgi:putative transposase